MDDKIIATFNPFVLDARRIEEFFTKHNIECYIHGSRVYAVTVPSRKAKDAATLLKQSEFNDKITTLIKVDDL